MCLLICLVQPPPRDIAKYKKMLDLEKQCKDFLFKLSPAEWQKQQKARVQISEKIKASAVRKEPDTQGNVCTSTHPTTLLGQTHYRHKLQSNVSITS